MTPKRLTDEEIRALMKRLDSAALLKPFHDICRAYNVPLQSVLRKERSKRVVLARDACCQRCIAIGFSSVEAGRLLGMDHTSVLLAVRRYKERDNGRALT